MIKQKGKLLKRIYKKNVQVQIWENFTPKGQKFPNIIIQNRFVLKGGGTKFTYSFRPSSIESIKLALDEAKTYLTDEYKPDS